MDEFKVNAVTCATWVPKGFAKENPDKVEVTKEELIKIIQETKCDIDDIEEDQYDRVEMEENVKGVDTKVKEENKENNTCDTKTSEVNVEIKKETSEIKEEEMEDVVTAYNLDEYDNEGENNSFSMHFGKLVQFPNEDDDPYITVKDVEDHDSEDGSHQILKTDNLIAVGHVDGDAAILEVHVYNSVESHFYIHHDILLPAVPMCMEWLNYDPSEEKPGNLLAVGTLSNIIDVWDLDLVNVLEPAYKLGTKAMKRTNVVDSGHKDAVLSLAWNKEYFHILASGSVDETVILWDLKEGKVSKQLSCFKEKVQTLQWHPNDPHHLLAGSCDKVVKMFDFREEDSHKSWKVDGEVECVQWNPTNNYQFIVSTDAGSIYCIDHRKKKPLWSITAHEDGVTGVKFSPTCPGCLVTASVDATMKIWDILPEKPQLVSDYEPNIGLIHTLTSCPDEPFVFFMGGDKAAENYKVVDIRTLGSHVRSRFCERVGLPVDEEMDEDDAVKSLSGLQNISISNSETPNTSVVSESETKGWKPKNKKFGKKKGGHLDKKKRKHK